MIKDVILICKVWRYDPQLNEMGIDANEWLDFAIDLRTVKAIKLTGGNLDATKDKAIIYISENIDDSFCINLGFNEVLKLWSEVLQ